jgi:hypothetical protein
LTIPQEFDYKRYLASREWAIRREAVRARCGGWCERCDLLPMQATHHLTYEHIGDEPLEDLQGVCRPCHAFLSGKSDFDPEHFYGAHLRAVQALESAYVEETAKADASELVRRLGEGIARHCGADLAMVALGRELARSIEFGAWAWRVIENAQELFTQRVSQRRMPDGPTLPVEPADLSVAPLHKAPCSDEQGQPPGPAGWSQVLDAVCAVTRGYLRTASVDLRGDILVIAFRWSFHHREAVKRAAEIELAVLQALHVSRVDFRLEESLLAETERV